MNGYKIVIFRPCYCRGKFTHNTVTEKTIHAETEKEARAQIHLKPECELFGDYSVGDEFIQSVRLLGRVVERIEYDYILDDTPA